MFLRLFFDSDIVSYLTLTDPVTYTFNLQPISADKD